MSADGSAADGSAKNPFATITAARNAARSAPGLIANIVVAHGSYVDTPDLDGFSKETIIDGGWSWEGAVWTRDCAVDTKSKTILRSPTSIGVLVRNAIAPVELTRLTIETAGPATTPDGEPGTSRYGVFVDRALVRLTGVTVRARAGDPGGLAKPGAPGSTRCDNATGATCTGGPRGDDRPAVVPPSNFGTFMSEGFRSATVSPGAAGTDGANGTPNGPGSSRSDCFNGCAPQPSCENANPAKTETSSPGQCGCGGTGGGAGENGHGGGGSFAVYAVGATSLVVVSYSELFAEAGGAGSAGGAGGAGGLGTTGQPGAAPICFPAVCCRVGDCTMMPPGCGCYKASEPGGWSSFCSPSSPPPALPLVGGAAGGPGQAGGKGADGAGGPGGPSFTFVRIDGAQVSINDTALSFSPGGAGAGGAPAGPSGPEPP